MTFLPILPSGNEISERESNPIPQSLYTCLPESAFLANLIPSKKLSFKVKLVFKSRGFVSNS